ncbi:hypothetical protein PsorP6_006218 [Peronosclerospora sorghi]|uniref:Uncharacterized protein n=1 Tax=Peronosclerospora sorghi TaxID=230839 RepID=A0ACC0W5T0_9STRA|nr:hypothetical protein PsorP6_006218 [Peronosclerospora sorghi]
MKTLGSEVEKVEAQHRLEKETRAKSQQEADQTTKQLECKLPLTHECLLEASTNVMNWRKNIKSGKQTLEKRDRALEQAHKALETLQLKILEQRVRDIRTTKAIEKQFFEHKI